MLIEFTYSNFLSYKDETSLLMTPVKSFKEHNDTHILKNNGFQLLKTAAIYGKNGGGKSNFISAMGFVKRTIHNSFADSLKKEEDRGRKNYNFKLNERSENLPSCFEVSFLLEDDVIYRYGFEINGFEIIKEWLFKKVGTETPLFERNRNKFKINSTSFSEGNKYKKDVNSNVLFLSHLAQNNTNVASKVFEWFKNLNVVSGLDDRHYKNVTKNLLIEVPEFKAWLSLAVKFLEISNIEASKDKNIVTYHNIFDENNVVVNSVAFDFEREESQGTKKLVYLLGAIYDTLMKSKVLFIDELDSKLHPNLSKKLLELFHRLNLRNAQFIFTAHDAVLLDKELFRRDQIWFVDRNKFGASELYPMSEFNAEVVRNTSDYRKKYLDSVFGAAATLDITDELIKLMY
jgi:AAA15 family ATPase/GTPase